MADAWSLLPGVYTEIRDTSFSIKPSGGTVGFICTLAEKGPDNQLQLVGKADEYISTFGKVDLYKYGQAGKIATRWLTISNNLYTIRVMPDQTNVPCQNTIYGKSYGEYSVGRITMREAAYANLGIALNELGQFEFIYVGPKDLGVLKSISLLSPPATAELGDKYYIPAAGNATGAWAGHNDEIAICISKRPLNWAFTEINDTCTAVVGTTTLVAAVVYSSGTPLLTWETYNDYYVDPEAVVIVEDVLDTAPTVGLVDGVKYLIANNPITPEWVGHEGKVATWNESRNTWVVKRYQQVFIELFYDRYLVPPFGSVVGDKYIVAEGTTHGQWIGHDGQIAEMTSTGWKFIDVPVSFIKDTTKAASVIITCGNEGIQIERKLKTVYIKDTIWTNDTNALFVSQAHKENQLKVIVDASIPSESVSRQSLEPLIMFYAVGRGTYYNNILLTMKLSSKAEHQTDDSQKTMIIDIFDTNSGSKLLMESYEVSLNPDLKDISGNSLYIVDVVNKYSSIIKCYANDKYLRGNYSYLNAIHTDVSNLFVQYESYHKIGYTTYPPSLLYGDNGSLYDKNGNINWEQANALLARAYIGQIINPMAEDQELPNESAVLDREMTLIDLIFDGGYAPEVKTSILTLIQARHGDCFGVVDLGDNASPKQAMNARTIAGGAGKNFNDPRIAIYEPYSMIYDPFTGKDIWISPVYHAVYAYAITDRDYGRYQAPAGMQRGMCPEIKKMRYNLMKFPQYYDQFVSYNINPIIETRDGHFIWGQSTSYLKPSYFQDVQIMRVIIMIQRDLERSLKYMVMDLNDPMTWNIIDTAVKTYLSGKISDNYIEGYSSRVYALDYDKTQHRCRVEITIKPKTVIYQILVTITV